MEVVKIKPTQVAEVVANTKGQFFSVEFVKKDGSYRQMNCRTGVKKHLRGGVATYSANPKNIGVYDQVTGAYRCFNQDRVISLTCAGKQYEVEK